MTGTKKEGRLERIAQHGRHLLAIFPHATETDPVKLCKRLRRLELAGNEIALRLCNGPEYKFGEANRLTDSIVAKVNALLSNRPGEDCVPIFLNRDPRGYALKISDRWMRDHANMPFERDWGGYGIIAPEID